MNHASGLGARPGTVRYRIESAVLALVALLFVMALVSLMCLEAWR